MWGLIFSVTSFTTIILWIQVSFTIVGTINTHLWITYGFTPNRLYWPQQLSHKILCFLRVFLVGPINLLLFCYEHGFCAYCKIFKIKILTRWRKLESKFHKMRYCGLSCVGLVVATDSSHLPKFKKIYRISKVCFIQTSLSKSTVHLSVAGPALLNACSLTCRLVVHPCWRPQVQVDE